MEETYPSKNRKKPNIKSNDYYLGFQLCNWRYIQYFINYRQVRLIPIGAEN